MAIDPPSTPATEWWRHAVIYQIYPRSFADSDGDGVGDLPGIAARLAALAELGVDAVWLSPFQRSPQHDAGYDVSDYCDVDPLFGTLADFDALVEAAHSLGIRVIVDIVPNHSSSEHPWFQAALAAGPGSPERARYVFRDGRGADGELPPNDWQAVFGGPAWERVTEQDGTQGQWYLHLFDVTQPDFDWDHPEVHTEFRRVLRFWLDRGVDGFRIDVAHGLVKHPDLPDYRPVDGREIDAPYWGQPGVHAIFRDWRALVDEYPGERVLCGEVWRPSVSDTAQWVRPGELHQTFNFEFLATRWQAAELRHVIDESIAEYGAVGAPSTWVLSNHDVIRHATRLALNRRRLVGSGLGPTTPDKPDPALGLRRARAATTLMLALPGSAYVYQGEELGLPEVIELPDEVRQDPTWFRSEGTSYGRDGCRVPIPWLAAAPSYGFGPGSASWLPQPAEWARLARDVQAGDPGSTLNLYRRLLALRREHALGEGTLEWLPGYPADVLAFRNGAVTVIANVGQHAVPIPEAAELLAASQPLDTGAVPADTTVWIASPG